MIKGVNRQVIEVVNTGNLYYERALLVVRPEYESAQRELLEREARRFVKGMKAPSAMKRRRIIISKAVFFILTAAAASAITLLIYTNLC